MVIVGKTSRYGSKRGKESIDCDKDEELEGYLVASRGGGRIKSKDEFSGGIVFFNEEPERRAKFWNQVCGSTKELCCAGPTRLPLSISHRHLTQQRGLVGVIAWSFAA